MKGRSTGSLNAAKVAALKEPGDYCDGNSLYLQISGAGTKSWLFRYRFGQKRRYKGLGPYPAVALQEAREAALNCKRLLQTQKDPIEEARNQKAQARLEAPPAICDAEQTFHLERLKANSSLKIISLDENGTENVQRFLNLTMQKPLKISAVPRVKVWVAWQYNTASFGGSAPAQGVIDIVQDNCVLYRRQAEASEIVAIANGNWSR